MEQDDAALDLASFTPFLLSQAAEAQSRAFSAIYKGRYGMLRTEWRVLYHLGRYGDLSATKLGARAAIHKTKISRAVRALEEKRFLKRRQNEADRRSAMLTLTRAGERAFEDLAWHAREHEARLAETLGPEAMAQLKATLIALQRS